MTRQPYGQWVLTSSPIVAFSDLIPAVQPSTYAAASYPLQRKMLLVLFSGSPLAGDFVTRLGSVRASIAFTFGEPP